MPARQDVTLGHAQAQAHVLDQHAHQVQAQPSGGRALGALAGRHAVLAHGRGHDERARLPVVAHRQALPRAVQEKRESKPVPLFVVRPRMAVRKSHPRVPVRAHHGPLAHLQPDGGLLPHARAVRQHRDEVVRRHGPPHRHAHDRAVLVPARRGRRQAGGAGRAGRVPRDVQPARRPKLRRGHAVHPRDGPGVLGGQPGEVRGAGGQHARAIPEAQLGRTGRGEQGQAPGRAPLVVRRQRALLRLLPEQLAGVVRRQHQQAPRRVRRVPQADPRRERASPRLRLPPRRQGLRPLGHVPAPARRRLVGRRDLPPKDGRLPRQAQQAHRLGLDHRVAPVPPGLLLLGRAALPR